MSAPLVPIDLRGGSVRLAGVVHLEPTAAGLALHRLPAWTQPQVVTPELQLIRSMPSGCRLEVLTDATTLELDVQLTVVEIGNTPTDGAGFDLVIDGELVDGLHDRCGTIVSVDMKTGTPRMEPGGPTTIRFDGMPARMKHVEVWLPHAAAVEVLELRLDGTAEAPTSDTRRWIHHGSSISHCLEAARPTGVWPAVAARLAGVDLQSLALAGQCQLDGFTARTIRDLPADVISCKIGINIVNGDTMRERTFVPALHAFLDTIREGHPDVPLLLVTPIFCAAHEEGPGPSYFRKGTVRSPRRGRRLTVGALNLRRIRQLEEEVVAARRSAGDANLHLLDGLDLFGPGDAHDLPDGLHPNAAGYQRIGERFHGIAFGAGGVFAA